MKQVSTEVVLFSFSKRVLRLFIFLFFGLAGFNVAAQCPPNIDFEQGDFSGWECYQAKFVYPGVLTTPILTGPISGRHDIISASTVPANDPWGLFPKICPNGSAYSARIGLETTGTNADIIKYTFTIPAGQDQFSLIYHYAMVINNAGGHLPSIQPRLTISVKNITDNVTDGCSSFDIAYANTDTLPGFLPSPVNSDVLYKPWAANSINLNGNAGKTIEISFTTTGCGAPGGTHFGYAYIDLNSDCSSSFVGATFCPDDTLVNVTAPFGYQSYQWFDAAYNPIGNQQTLVLNPPPLAGSIVYVELTPYNGYGCKDTLTAHLWDTLTIAVYAGRDTTVCASYPVQLGAPPKLGLIYSWSPATGLNNPAIANPIATVNDSIIYTLTVKNSGGGCLTRGTVKINIPPLSDSLQLIGSASSCTASGPVLLKVFPADSIQWYRDAVFIPGANQTTYAVTQTGSYHAILFRFATPGCNVTTRVQQVDIYESPVGGFTVNTTAQCMKNNQFIFTNTSTISAGTLKYNWDLGDGTTDTTTDIIHSYAQPGTYLVILWVTAAGSCVDSASFTVIVYQVAYADFHAAPVCVDQRVPLINRTNDVPGTTVNYLWDFGNGQFSTDKTPVYSYTVGGNYPVKLSTSTTRCALDVYTKLINVFIEDRIPGVSYPVVNAIMNFPDSLRARQIGNSVLWLPSTSLDNWRSYTPVFRGLNDQLYIIQLRTASGCLTVDTQFVKTRKNIKIYVPTIFTPADANGRNDYLRPLLMSFVKVNYFRIYDRWGKLLFQMQNDRPGWDGKVNGQYAELQTVVWMIEAVDVDGVVHREQGTTILMR